MRLPAFVEQEVESISLELSPANVGIRELLSRQQEYNKKAVRVEGSVKSVVSIDETDEATVASWWLEIIPTTVETTASATYFYLEDPNSGDSLLVKYPADLGVSAEDNLVIVGFFSAHAVTVETKGMFRTSKKEVFSPLGEPFLTAILAENRTRQKIEYIRKTKS